MSTPIVMDAERGHAGGERALQYHFSVDDVFDSFIDVSDRGIPLFEHPFFAFLKRLHDEYGAAVHLYLFYRKTMKGRWRTLEEVSDCIGDTLRRNQWLHLGPHALDYDTPPYKQTADEQIRVFDSIYAQLDRFAPGAAWSRWLRLHCFSEAYEIAPYFRARGVEALLTTDKDAIAYRIPIPIRESLRDSGRLSYSGITLIRSNFRMECLSAAGLEVPATSAVDSVLQRHGLVVLMTHECEIERPEVRDVTARVLHNLATQGVIST